MEDLLTRNNALIVTLIGALAALILRSVVLSIQYWLRVRASIHLIRQYAEQTEDNIKERIKTYEVALENIKQGNPYGEPANDYTPLLSYNKEYELSFEQISELLRYLIRGKTQKLLLRYFASQSRVDSIINATNTDYFRSLPQRRKKNTFEILIKETKKLNLAAKPVKRLGRCW